MTQHWARSRHLRGGWLCLALACADPSVDAVVDALGPEQPGVPQGPLHRPGQPCATCHQSAGPGSPDFSLAGTVYQDEVELLPLEGVAIELVDSDGREHSTSTNCAGNFYIESDRWQPTFPVWVRLRYGDLVIDMETPIYRERACATCHADPAGPDRTTHVFLSEDPLGLPVTGCP